MSTGETSASQPELAVLAVNSAVDDATRRYISAAGTVSDVMRFTGCSTDEDPSMNGTWSLDLDVSTEDPAINIDLRLGAVLGAHHKDLISRKLGYFNENGTLSVEETSTKPYHRTRGYMVGQRPAGFIQSSETRKATAEDVETLINLLEQSRPRIPKRMRFLRALFK